MVLDTSWTIELKNDSDMTASAITIDDGWPDFTVGRQVGFSFLFDASTEQSYNRLLEYGTYLYDGAVHYGTDYEERPYYREQINPDFSAGSSYLFKITPTDRVRNLQGWWVLIEDIEDETLYQNGNARVNLSGFVIAPADEGDRAYIEAQYEVN